MELMEFLSKNWSQLAVLIGALGYILKIILDFSIKKKEIKFEYIYKAKASAFQELRLFIQNALTTLPTLAFAYKYGSSTFEEFETAIEKIKDDYQNKLHALLMYCNKVETESLYAILNSYTNFLSDIKKADKIQAESILIAHKKKNTEILNKISKSFHI